MTKRDNTQSDEPLELRSKPRPVTRLNKKVLMGLTALGSCLIFGSLIVALNPPSFSEGDRPKELYNTANKPTAEALADLPKTYTELPPKLGAPLPGDLGPAVYEVEKDLGLSDVPDLSDDTLPFRPDPVEDALRAERIRLARLAIQAKESKVFFTVTTPKTGEDRQSAHLAPASVPSNQTSLQVPSSPYTVMAGSLIPASLITGLNSDVKGNVVAQVTAPVFDSVTGQHLLIPQGARLIGTYKSDIAYGDERAIIHWSRLILPNGRSIELEEAIASDAQGFAGLHDRVDNHTGKLVKGVVLATILGVGSEIANDDNESNLVKAIRESAGDRTQDAASKIVDRFLNVKPTLTVRPGWLLTVIVTQDLSLAPYKGPAQ